MQQFMMLTWIKRNSVMSPGLPSFMNPSPLVILLVACMIGLGGCQSGLFPPTRLGRNLAPSNPVQATSVCGETNEGVGHEENYCAPDGSLLTCRQRTCDGGCLYNSRISDGLDVLAEGTLGPNVVSSYIRTNYCKHFSTVCFIQRLC